MGLEHQQGRRLEKGLHTIARGQQAIDPRAQHRIASAGVCKIRLAFGVVARQGAFEDALYSRPVVQRVHPAMSSL